MNSELFHINIHEIPGRRKFYLHKLLLQSFVRVETTELLDRFEQVLQRCDSDVIDTHDCSSIQTNSDHYISTGKTSIDD